MPDFDRYNTHTDLVLVICMVRADPFASMERSRMVTITLTAFPFVCTTLSHMICFDWVETTEAKSLAKDELVSLIDTILQIFLTLLYVVRGTTE